jgi:hypothetical protein
MRCLSIEPDAKVHARAILKTIRQRNYGSEKLQAPAKLMPHVFLGDAEAAMDMDHLKTMGINCIVNCASGSVLTSADYYDGNDFSYVGFEAHDMPGYDLLGNHFDETKKTLDTCRSLGKKALVHCAAGINRSAALCVAYYMVSTNQKLLNAVRHCFAQRPIILVNEGFVEQLVVFARSRNLL